MGSSQMFRFTGNKEWSREMRAAVCLFWGRWGIPVPYKHDIISLVGAPVTGTVLLHLLKVFIKHHVCTDPVLALLVPSSALVQTVELLLKSQSQVCLFLTADDTRTRLSETPSSRLT